MAAQQAYNVGRDGAQLVIVAGGTALAPPLITNFTSSQETVSLKSKPLSGPPLFQEVPDGWKGSFDCDRTDATLDSYFAQAEAAYYNGEDAITVSILHTIVAAAVGGVGAVSQFLYSGVVLKLEDAGAYAADAVVKQKVSFMASTRVQTL